MGDTNYIGGIVKILETPRQKRSNNKDNFIVTKCRAQLPQIRNTQIVNLIFWGTLARDVSTYYKINDYILIEGYLSVRNKSNKSVSASTSKNIEISVLKIYPFLLSYNRPVNKTQD